jgi:hypothetical protein
MKTTAWLILLVCLVFVSNVNPSLAQTANPAGRVVDQVTVPLMIENNRPFININLRRADGSTRVARFLVDSGGGAFQMTEPLVRDLGLHWGETHESEGNKFAVLTEVPKAFVGDFPLELNPERVGVALESDNILPPVAGHADGMLPGMVLAHYLVIFDYPQGKFTTERADAERQRLAYARWAKVWISAH